MKTGSTYLGLAKGDVGVVVYVGKGCLEVYWDRLCEAIWVHRNEVEIVKEPGNGGYLGVEFKLGDIVRVVKRLSSLDKKEGEVAAIKGIKVFEDTVLYYLDNPEIGYTPCQLKLLKKNEYPGGRKVEVYSEGLTETFFGLQVLRVIFEGNKTILHYRQLGSDTERTVVAKCHPNDTFLESKGYRIAVLKAYQELIPLMLEQVGNE